MVILATSKRRESIIGVKIKRKTLMALSKPGACASGGLSRVSPSAAGLPSCGGFVEGGHQLEKLEFALAVAITRGDQARERLLREQIDALGGNVEEPGT